MTQKTGLCKSMTKQEVAEHVKNRTTGPGIMARAWGEFITEALGKYCAGEDVIVRLASSEHTTDPAAYYVARSLIWMWNLPELKHNPVDVPLEPLREMLLGKSTLRGNFLLFPTTEELIFYEVDSKGFPFL